MPEGPTESRGTRAAPMRVPAAGPEDDFVWVAGLAGEVPGVVVKPDLVPAAVVFFVVSLLGPPLGWVWARMAPGQESIVGGNGQLTPLLVESYHRFDALAIFLLFGFAAGLLTSAALWLVRRRRGPVVLIAAVLGSVVSAWSAIHLGASFAASLYPAPPSPQVGSLIAVAPEAVTSWALVAQPLAVALGYGLAASWNGRDDLGRPA